MSEEKSTTRQGLIGPLYDPVKWYKITHDVEQDEQWDFQTKGRSRWHGLVRVALFWKSHCATCSPACVIL